MTSSKADNRYLAFAFSNADLLLEIDQDCKILFALGAGHPLCFDDVSLMTGRCFADFLAPCDVKLVNYLINNTAVGQRFGPIQVSAKVQEDTRPILLSGCRFPDQAGILSLTLSFAASIGPAMVTAQRDSHTGLVERRDFEDVAVEALRSARKSGQAIKLSLFSVSGQEAFASRVDSDVAEEFLARVGAILRSESYADAASLQGDGKYAILHESGAGIDRISERIAEASRALDPSDEGICVQGGSIDVEPHMNARDAASALVFAINKFAADETGHFKPDHLGGSLETLMKETGAKMAQFRHAIAQRKLGFMIQPIVELKTTAVHHHEMLVRFDKDKSPFEMIRFAEETGLVMELDEIILQKAIAYLSKAVPENRTCLAINVSGRSLSSMKFMANLYSALTKITFPRSMLMLEITESSIIEDLQKANALIQKIRKLGHRVCLDDFGAGAASFQYLRALTVDYIKIDGAYIRTALKQKREALMLKAMAALAHDLSIRTIAESIETKEQSSMLLGLGIDQGQGYLFGRPQTLQETCTKGKAA